MSEPVCLHVDNIPLGLVCNLLWQADSLAGGGDKLSRQAMARYARLKGCDSLVLARERFGILQRAGMRHVSVGNGTLTPARRGKKLSLAVLAQRHLAKGVAVLCLPTSEGLLYWVWAARANVLSARGDVLVSARGKALKLAQSIAASLGLTGPRVFDEDESLALLRELARAATREKAGEAALLPLEPVSLGRIVLVSLMGLWAAALLIGGQTMWEWWETRARTTLLSQTREELAKKREDIKRNPEKYFDISWQKRPSASSFVLAVVPGMLAYPLSGNGWVLQELAGTEKGLSARWKAHSSALLLFPPGDAVNDVKNPGVATQTLPRSLALPKGSLTKEDWVAAQAQLQKAGLCHGGRDKGRGALGEGPCAAHCHPGLCGERLSGPCRGRGSAGPKHTEHHLGWQKLEHGRRTCCQTLTDKLSEES